MTKLKSLKPTSVFCALLGAVMGFASAPSFSAEPSQVPLISVQEYDPSANGGFVRNFGNAVVGFVTATAGTVYWNRSLDLHATLREQVNAVPELKAYFPNSREVDSITRELAERLNRQVKSPLTNPQAVFVVRQATVGLMRPIIDRVMLKEGVTSAERRKVWAERILKPFQECTGRARAYPEAKECLDSMQAAISQNLGLALVHELQKQELASSLTDQRARDRLESFLDEEYRGCLGISADAAQKVKPCVLRSMRAGIYHVSDQKLMEALARQLKAAQLQNLKTAVLPPFAQCLNSGATAEDFKACIDGLTISAGAEATQARVSSEPAVVSAVGDAGDRKKLAFEMRQIFEKCMQDQKRANARVGGMLVTDPCENRILNRVTAIVLKKQFRASAEETLGADDPEISAITARAEKHVRSCWDDEQAKPARESCVRSSIVYLANQVSDRQIDKLVPEELRRQEANLKPSLLSTYDACLKKELPVQVTDSPDRDKKIAECSGRIRKTAAIRVARYELKKAFGTYLKPADLEALIASEVQGNFSRCLGAFPQSADLDNCSLILKRNAAKRGGALILPEQARLAMGKTGKPLSDSESAAFERFLKENVNGLGRCLDSNLKKHNAEQADVLAMDCFQRAVSGVVSYIARVQFERESGAMYRDRPKRGQDLRDQFVSRLTQCVESRIEAHPAMDVFMDGVDSCANEGAIQATRDVGIDQVEAAAAEYLTDLRLEKERRELNELIVPQFAGCLSKADPRTPKDRLACADQLQRRATEMMVLAIGRTQTEDQLGKSPLPEAAALETQLKGCIARASTTELSAQLNDCTKNYTLTLSSAVGGLKVRSVMQSTLGKDQYGAVSRRIDRSLERYDACLSKLRVVPLGKSLLDGIGKCAAHLQDDARNEVYVALHEGLGSPTPGTTQGSAAKEALAALIPCLDSFLPTSPEKQISDGGVDAEGMIKALVKMIQEYVDYDASKADGDVPRVIAQLREDMQSVGPGEARRKLFQLLAESGVFDQMLRSLVRSNVVEAFDAMPEEQKIADAVKAQLSDRANFDRIFLSERGKALRERALQGILKPVLVDGRALDTSIQASLKRDIAHLLADSPDFGTVLISATVQKEMDDMNGVVRFFAKVIYGENSLHWDKIRGTARGKKAEEFIRENVLKPKMTGDALSPEEEKARLEKAKDLVTEAVKSAPKSVR